MTDTPRFGIASLDQIAGLTGLEFLRRMIAGELPGPPIGATLGFRLAEAEPGRVVFEGMPSAALLNPLGSVHGGWALALIDSATGCSLHSELPPDTGYTTVETKVNFTRPIPQDGGIVRC
ncbi:MAG: phenylacetic acid degradation-like protein, partial [Alphaproteobacteria bacterium]|nr:phenylacetic acid degradation-like protein [Alphaproteobacteria bacterium]